MANDLPASDTSVVHQPPRGVVVIGASAGGVEALTEAAPTLPADLPFTILIALHLPPSAPSVLARIIGRHSPLPASAATDGGALERVACTRPSPIIT